MPLKIFSQAESVLNRKFKSAVLPEPLKDGSYHFYIPEFDAFADTVHPGYILMGRWNYTYRASAEIVIIAAGFASGGSLIVLQPVKPGQMIIIAEINTACMS